MEYFLHVYYRLNFKKWQPKGVNEKKGITCQQKTTCTKSVQGYDGVAMKLAKTIELLGFMLILIIFDTLQKKKTKVNFNKFL